MFEDALLESGGKITTHRTWFSGVAAILQLQHRMPAGAVAFAASRISAQADVEYAAGGSRTSRSALGSYAALGERCDTRCGVRKPIRAA
jgi:predicted component of type VI protein secretion system